MNRYAFALLGVAVGALLATALFRVAEGDSEDEYLDVVCERTMCSALGIPCPAKECKIEGGDGTRAVYARAADGEEWEIIMGLLVLDDGTVYDGRGDIEALERFSETGELPVR